MAAECGGPADLDRAHDAPFNAPEVAGMITTIGIAMAAENHLEDWRPGRHFGRLNPAA
jgi:hypothetical protein